MPNANVLEAKKAIVAEMTEKLQNAASGVLVDYKGITSKNESADWYHTTDRSGTQGPADDKGADPKTGPLLKRYQDWDQCWRVWAAARLRPYQMMTPT